METVIQLCYDGGQCANEATIEEILAEREAMRILLLKIGWVLEQPCWRTYGALATLLNDIKDLLGEVDNE